MFDPLSEPVLVERTETGVERAVVIDEDERRLAALIKPPQSKQLLPAAPFGQPVSLQCSHHRPLAATPTTPPLPFKILKPQTGRSLKP